MFRLPTITLRTLLLIPLATVVVLLDAPASRATSLYVDASCSDNTKAGTSPNCADGKGPKRTIQNGINAAVESDEIVVAPGTYESGLDCNENGIPDHQDIADLTSPDCNSNGIPDECGIDGNSTAPGGPYYCAADCDPDCNDNGVPDMCDVANLTSPDCNGNLVPDACDIVAGTSPDTDASGVPDECEVPILYVKHDAAGTNDGTSWADAYVSMQSALATARSSVGATSEIWVARGMYTPVPPGGNRAVSFDLITGVALYGGFAGWEALLEQREILANETILSGDLNGDDDSGGDNNENSYHVVTGFSVDATAILDGFIITRGNGNGTFLYRNGGGLYNNGYSSPTVSNCTFTGNTVTYYGGGMYNNEYSSPTVIDCTFVGNSAESRGGGMYNVAYSSPTVTRSTFSGNTAEGWGGGMLNDDGSSPTLTHCTFSENTAHFAGGGMQNIGSSPTLTRCTFSGNTADFVGGGMHNSDDSSPTVTHCTFSGNTATVHGGGMSSAYDSSPTVTNCAFSENRADNGGGMYNQNNGSPTVTNSTFSGNIARHGGAMFNTNSSSPVVTNCTFSGNTATNGYGGGMRNSASSSPTVSNCILWGDVPDEIFNYIRPGEDSPTVSYSDVQGGLGAGTIDGGGNIDVDPAFADADGADDVPGNEDDDLRLGACSLAVDAGDNSAVPDGITADLEGNPRFVDDPGIGDTGAGTPPVVDMGAFERQEATPTGVVQNVTQGTLHCGIQEAINAAVGGDEIVVPIGTYTETIGFLGKAITVRSIDPSDPAVVAATIIDGTGLKDRVVRCISGEGPDTVLDGFTITGGDGHACPAPAESYMCGGGMYNYDSSPTVTNCTFIRNSADYGAGMYNRENSSPVLTNCAFSGNSATNGGGGMGNFNNSNPTATNCTFSGNSASLGAGIYNYISSSPTVTNCTFSGNKAKWGGGIQNYSSSSPTVTNCMFSGNAVDFGGGGMLNNSSSPTVTNCTFSGNTAGYGSGMYNYSSSSPTVSNCILWGDTADEIFNEVPSDDSPTVSYSDVQGGVTDGTIDGGGNLDADPVFVRNPNDGGDGWGDDPDTPEIDEGVNDDFGDLRLQSGSPCIDTGNNNAPGLVGVSTDLDGYLRMMDDPDTPDGGNPGAPEPPIVDMGSYEYWPDCNGNDVPDAVDVLEGASVDCNTNGVPDECEPGGLEDCNANGTTDWCDIRAGTSDDCDDNTIADECELPFTPVVYVHADAAGANTGRSWGDAYTSLTDALSQAACTPIVTEIRVAQGTYKPGTDRIDAFRLVSGVAVRGGFAGYGAGNPDDRDIARYETILSGDIEGDDVEVASPAQLYDEPTRADNSYHVVTGVGTDATAVLDGFVVTAGRADRGNSTEVWGGGMWNQDGSPTVTNCIFRGNFGGEGGGMAGGGSPTVTNCAFIANSAYWGGGMANIGGSATVINCTFSGNSANHDFDGGGMYNRSGSSPTVINCTFSGNSAERFGGAVCNWGAGSPTLANCTLSDNVAGNSGGGIYNLNSTPVLTNCILWADLPNEISGPGSTVTYSDVQGGTGQTWFGNGCMDEDPVFVGHGNWNDNGTPGDHGDDFWVDGDYRLQAVSTCINSGDAAVLPADSIDLDGDGDDTESIPIDRDRHARVLCGEVDMGAYEFGIGDYDCDDAVDLLDFSMWAACITGPDGGSFGDGCEAFDFDGDGNVDMADFAGYQRVFTSEP